MTLSSLKTKCKTLQSQHLNAVKKQWSREKIHLSYLV